MGKTRVLFKKTGDHDTKWWSMWSNCNFCALFLEVINGTNKWFGIFIQITYPLSTSTVPFYVFVLKKWKHMSPWKDLYMRADRNFMHNNEILKITQISINKWLDNCGKFTQWYTSEVWYSLQEHLCKFNLIY